VLVPKAFILGAKEYHVQQGTVISLVCMVENVSLVPGRSDRNTTLDSILRPFHTFQLNVLEFKFKEKVYFGERRLRAFEFNVSHFSHENV